MKQLPDNRTSLFVYELPFEVSVLIVGEVTSVL